MPSVAHETTWLSIKPCWESDPCLTPYRMVSKSLALLLSTALYARSALAADAADIVDTGYAKYLGIRTFPDSVAYLGIPYAEPPLGERRFRAPLPLNTTRVTEHSGEEVIDATEYPEFCIQGPLGRTCAGFLGHWETLKVPSSSCSFQSRRGW